MLQGVGYAGTEDEVNAAFVVVLATLAKKHIVSKSAAAMPCYIPKAPTPKT